MNPCQKCGADYLLREGCEPTAFCDSCAQIILDDLLEALEKIQKILGEALPVDYKRDCLAALKIADIALSNLAKAKGEA